MSHIHVVLLSGGSGTRLWPLSTNSRPKQFLKVLRDEDDNHVSMVQRVFGQIGRVPADLDITVATSAVHREYLESQLGGGFATVLEPERRDTAPAIMLACANLALAQGAAADDTVIVAPIDTYADQGYYDRFPLLDQAVQKGVADLVLLGVKPTYPSEKYGYILPGAAAAAADASVDADGPASSDSPAVPVREFKEKPDEATAREFIREGGLWNCGVFAFRLSYLTAITERYYRAASFEDLRDHYSALPKISFDYEVVEKAQSVAAVPYEGQWKDLGTWNTLTDEMAEAVSGRVTMDAASCRNTHVVNETNVPVVVAGVSDAAVVVTPDGILVTGKEESAHIKGLVSEAQLSRPMYEKRPWGEYHVLAVSREADGREVLTQELAVAPSDEPRRLGHAGYSEVWTVTSGAGTVSVDGRGQEVAAGDVVRIPAGSALAVRTAEGLHVVDVRVPEGVNPFLDVQGELRRWQEHADACSGQIRELLKDENELADSFCRDVAFGTGGIRGKMGAGPNRLNVYTVARATQGLAGWLRDGAAAGAAPFSVAIAYDTRRDSDTFARVTAEVLAANGIAAHVFPAPVPTPVLSFAVRDLGCAAGVVITASHNRKEYNGYKVYGADGCQITTEDARDILARIKAIDLFDGVSRADYDGALASGLIAPVGSDLVDRYERAVRAEAVPVDAAAKQNLKVVYTPLNGTGAAFVPKVLADEGFADVTTVARQMEPDSDFTSCPYPNPEFPEAWREAKRLAEEAQADIAIATDPDCDRMGVLVRHGGGYRLLSGNDAGVLMLDWLCRRELAAGHDLRGRVVVTTIVTAPMADAVAARYGFELRRTLTGFKFVGEQIGRLEAAGERGRFLFGLEESIGYLKGTYARDKDGVVASLLACEMAADLKAQGVDLVDRLAQLNDELGHHVTRQISVPYPGIDGPEAMRAVVSRLRENPPAELAGLKVLKTTDYVHGAPMPGDPMQTLPASNVLQWDLEGGSRLIVRPSGTEPKLKTYLSVRAATADAASSLLDHMDADVHRLIS